MLAVPALLTGTLLGLPAAWRGGWIDTVLHGLSDMLVALPALLVVLIFSAMAGGQLWTLYIGLALAQWVENFRIVRTRNAVLLAGPTVEAAALLRLGPVQVLRRHLWPELRPLLVTLASFGAADPRARRVLWGRQISLLPQEPMLALDPTMRARNQVAQGARGFRSDHAGARHAADRLLTPSPWTGRDGRSPIRCPAAWRSGSPRRRHDRRGADTHRQRAVQGA